MSLSLYSEKYARKWRGTIFDDEPIKFDRYRFAGNSNSSSMDETRKNRVIVTTRTLRALLFLSLSTRLRTRWRGEGSIRRIITVETFTPFGIPWEKHSIPERRKCGEAKERERERERKRRRGRRRLKRQKEQGHERAAFRFPHHFAPFTEGRAPRKGWLTALIVPVVTVYSDFHPVFFTRSLPLFFQLNPPAHSPLRHPAVQIIVTVRRPWPNSSRNERISLADLVIPRQPETSSFLLLLWNRHPLSLRNESNRFSTLCSLFATSLRPLVVPLNRGNHLLPLDLSYSIMWHQFLSITLFSVSFFIYLFLISLVSAK